MPLFRIHRMKDAPRQQFRWAPHVSGAANAKPKDYEPAGQIEAETEYAAWAALRQSGQALEIGDILEILSFEGQREGALRICKYVGFEEARWFIPEQLAGSGPGNGPAASEAASRPQATQA